MSILAGLIFYIFGIRLDDNLKGLFINISSGFFAIPLIFLFYDIAKNFASKELNKEIFDYAKMQVDREIMSVLNQLGKMTFPTYEGFNLSEFIKYDKEQLRGKITSKKFLGFQVLKKWKLSEKYFDEILNNAFILNRLDNDQIISVISIIKSIRHLEAIQEKDIFIRGKSESAKGYKIISGQEISIENRDYPDRLLLLFDIGNDNYVVKDFGDFRKSSRDKLLDYFTVNESLIEFYIEAIYSILSDIRGWIKETGNEIILDPKMFRFVPKKIDIGNKGKKLHGA